jgi:hypothetical protein
MTAFKRRSYAALKKMAQAVAFFYKSDIMQHW